MHGRITSRPEAFGRPVTLLMAIITSLSSAADGVLSGIIAVMGLLVLCGLLLAMVQVKRGAVQRGRSTAFACFRNPIFLRGGDIVVTS